MQENNDEFKQRCNLSIVPCMTIQMDESMMLNERGMELFAAGVEVYKKPILVSIGSPLTVKTTVHTMEGVETALPGYRIITGPRGEQYALDPDGFAQYEQSSPGIYFKKKTIVRALKLGLSATVSTVWGAVLTAKPYDYLVLKSPNDMWIVDQEIFDETYAPATTLI